MRFKKILSSLLILSIILPFFQSIGVRKVQAADDLPGEVWVTYSIPEDEKSLAVYNNYRIKPEKVYVENGEYKLLVTGREKVKDGNYVMNDYVNNYLSYNPGDDYPAGHDAHSSLSTRDSIKVMKNANFYSIPLDTTTNINLVATAKNGTINTRTSSSQNYITSNDSIGLPPQIYKYSLRQVTNNKRFEAPDYYPIDYKTYSTYMTLQNALTGQTYPEFNLISDGKDTRIQLDATIHKDYGLVIGYNSSNGNYGIYGNNPNRQLVIRMNRHFAINSSSDNNFETIKSYSYPQKNSSPSTPKISLRSDSDNLHVISRSSDSTYSDNSSLEIGGKLLNLKDGTEEWATAHVLREYKPGSFFSIHHQQASAKIYYIVGNNSKEMWLGWEKLNWMVQAGMGAVLDTAEDCFYYIDNSGTYKQYVDKRGENQKLFDFQAVDLLVIDEYSFFYTHPDHPDKIFLYSTNKAPKLNLTHPQENSTYVNEEGIITVSGTASDQDNDNLIVTATLAGVTKTTTLTNTLSAKSFSFNFDIVGDEIPEGNHKVEVSVKDTPFRSPSKATRNIIVQARVKHDGFVLAGSPLYYKLIYQDEESDPKYQEQFRYIHNPDYFKNSIGIIPDSNTWRNTVYNSLDKTGHYKVTTRAKDNPKNLTTFDEFKMWSRESLSEINLYVHRKPIAVFKASINTVGNLTITDVDKSYDLDHQGEINNGIISKQWRWRKTEDITWTTSNNPPTSFTPGQNYILGLRVKDKDGENGIGVWGDWTDITIGTGALAPLNALFTLNPNVVSHNPSKTITTTNLSSGSFTKSEWIIKNSSGTQVGAIITTNVPTSAQLKIGGIGKYTLQLRVGDATRWSEPYTLAYEVINNPPIANFESPDVVYRDTNISLINKIAADLDGDIITYQWKLKQPNTTEYNISTVHSPTFNIQNLISSYGINPISAISKNWEIKLIATDAKGAKSEFTKDLEVINSIPEAKINGPISAKQYTSYNYTSSDTDADTGDNPLSIFRWKHIKPDGSSETYATKDITLTFNDHGSHTLEHYVIDRIGDKSNIASLSINVEENKAPSMIITAPNGTITNPSIIPGDPLIKWTYSDPENDPQEKYSFDFYYADDDILVKSITNDDSTGSIRKHQVPENTFERFRKVKAVSRTYSKFKWSELSNQVYFIINDAPTGGFNLNTNPANYVRNEEIKITGFGDDPNIERGDSISYKYYLKKLPSGSEILISSEKDFTHIINSLTSGQNKDTYQIRQVITDSLGFTAPEVIKTFTINNQKPTVEIVEPSSSNSSDPTLISEVDLMPTIRWDYTDLDGDNQKRYKVTIYNGTTNNVVISSGEIASENKHWTVSNPLVEDILYSVIVEVYDGHEWSISDRKYFKVFSLKVSGYLAPNPAMAGDQILFFITTEGYADKIEIVVPSDLIAMDKRVDMGYPAVTYPSIFFNIDKNIMKKEDILEYIVWVSTEDTLNKDNVRLRPPYKFTVRAYKGTVTREIELELDIKGSILELLKPGIKNKNGK